MKIRVTRRQIALGLLASVGGVAAAYWSLHSGDRTPLDLELPSARNPFAPTYEEYLALSQIVLVRPHLDEEVARRLYQIFIDEPWGPKHIGHAYAVLSKDLEQRSRVGENNALVSFSGLESGEKWFISHLLTTWYLGIYYHEQRSTQRVTYEYALMFDAIRGTIPIPFVESTGFGAWSEPPPDAGKTKL